jgi:hypothetical protein
MFMRRESSWSDRILPLALGLGAAGAAGAAVAAGAWVRRRRGESPLTRIEALEDAVLARLLGDPVLRERPIDVGGLGDGIVELSGSVRTEEEAERAVRLSQEAAGVRTVLNRLDVAILAVHLDETRRRFQAGEPRLHETHWYGQRVGTGRRRQTGVKEPARPDDKVPIQTRALGADRATELSSEELAKVGPGVTGHTTAPGGPIDRGRVHDASHRRVGNVPAEPIQELHPEARLHRPVKKGTEVTLEAKRLGRRS